MKRNIALLLVLAFALTACAGMEARTADERARITIDSMQDTLSTLFDTGKAYVALHPEKLADWKTKVVPAIDLANKSLKTAITMSSSGNITSDQAYSLIQPLIVKVIILLVQIGAIDQ